VMHFTDEKTEAQSAQTHLVESHSNSQIFADTYKLMESTDPEWQGIQKSARDENTLRRKDWDVVTFCKCVNRRFKLADRACMVAYKGHCYSF
jgi:hypothetical protein